MPHPPRPSQPRGTRPQPSRGRPPATRREARRRRGPSRRVRLTRTITFLVVAVLGIVLVSTHPWSDDPPKDIASDTTSGDGGSADRTTPSGSASSGATPTTGTATSTATTSADGSATPDPTTITVPQHGNGTITPVAIPGAQSTATGRTVTYSVEIEGGLGVDPTQVAATIRAILLDRRGWQKQDGVRLVALQPKDLSAGRKPDIRVTLASPGLTDDLCAPLKTLSQVSCWNGSRSVLNLRRWLQGDDSYGTDVPLYRVYQVNHEFGHGLGHGHEQCPGPGKRAPVMMQQTLTLGACKPWPYPQGA